MTAVLPGVSTPMKIPPDAPAEWNIAAIVTELRKLRDASLAARQRLGRPVKLPSRRALAGILELLSAALFPNRLGKRVLADESVDFFVGSTLDTALRDLTEQVARELNFAAGESSSSNDDGRPPTTLVREFAACLPSIRALLETDIQAAYESDPAAGSIDEVLVCNPGIRALIHHRLAHALHHCGAPLVARTIAEIAHSATGIDIHPGATIAGSFFIDHGTGVVIGETAVIGQRVRLHHGVTLGAKQLASEQSRTLVRGTPRHPIIEDDVAIYAGATLLGRITIGRGSVIGGNVWLTTSVPPGSNISQAEVRHAAFENGSGI